MIATTEDKHSIVMFQTNIGHAGEFIDSILQQRQSDIAKPILMSDALASNRPSQCDATMALCNSHARRQFADIVSHFPEEVELILTRYAAIWTHDDESDAQNHTPSERLAYHQQNSQPVMDEI